MTAASIGTNRLYVAAYCLLHRPPPGELPWLKKWPPAAYLCFSPVVVILFVAALWVRLRNTQKLATERMQCSPVTRRNSAVGCFEAWPVRLDRVLAAYTWHSSLAYDKELRRDLMAQDERKVRGTPALSDFRLVGGAVHLAS